MSDCNVTLPYYLAPPAVLRALLDLLREWAYDLLHAARDIEAALEGGS